MATEEINTTEDYGYTEVVVSKVGDYVGSSQDGNPVQEHFTEESLKQIADDSEGREYLVDQDHSSMKKGLDRDTKSAGWLKNLFFKDGELRGRIFWTSLGHALSTSRIYRFLSPVFKLRNDGTPSQLINVSLTNTPAQHDIAPVINQSSEIDFNEDYIDMTKDEVIELIKATIAEMENEKSETVEETTEETVEETVETPVEETVEDKPEDEVANECDKPEETDEKPEVENEEPEEKVEKDKELICEECLNSAPMPSSDVSGKSAWEGLHGKEFFDWLAKNKKNI